jgi:hypothetical protein
MATPLGRAFVAQYKPVATAGESPGYRPNPALPDLQKKDYDAGSALGR